MDRRIKLLLDLVGSLIGLAAVVVFYSNEQVALAVTLAVVTVGVVVGTIIHVRIPRISYKSLKWYLEFQDPKAEVALWRKEVILVPHQKDVTSFVDRNISSSGQTEVLESNVGDVYGPFDEGGNSVVTTVLRAPLPVGEPFTRVLRLRVTESFSKPNESLAMVMDHRYHEAAMHIRFPKERVPTAVHAYGYWGDEAEELEVVQGASDGTEVDLLIPRPRLGAKYIVEWTW